MGMEIIKGRAKESKVVLILLGTILMAVSVNIVYEPMDMVTGGLTGLAIIIKHYTKSFLDGGIPIWLTNFVINIPLFIAAICLKGKKFIGKTLFATVCFTVALYFIPVLDIGYKDFLLASVFGGVIGGIGIGFVLAAYASTGGTDLLGIIIHEYARHYSVPTLLMIIDSIIVLIGAVVFGMNRALYAVIAVFITAKVSDSILEGLKFAKGAFIISDKYEQIAEKILEELERGVTGLAAQGMYSKADKKMLYCVVSKKEMAKLTQIVSDIDRNAFVIVNDVREVLGEGFMEYRQ